ncbi:MAG: hypothetical protein E7543_04940 [Ruminococcaceae bacterium]|nr:hypothetical protein [Oscillospiraceae bacterium]
MSLKIKNILILLILSALLLSLSLPCSASLMVYGESLYGSEDKIMCISYRGDTALYPENSLEGVLSAEEKGADGVSVGVEKTSDGIYVLTEEKKLSAVTDAPYESVGEITYDELQNYYLKDNTGALTKYRMVSLSQTISLTGEDFIIIVDAEWDEADGIYDLISHYGAFDRIIIRVKESASKVSEWISSKPERVNVISPYQGNIIFSAASNFNKMSQAGSRFVQYQTKNYFGVVYGSFFCKRFADENAPKAIAPMYDLDLSGQRTDSQEGWNEVIEAGYSVIETNNLVSLVSYIDRHEKAGRALGVLAEKASLIAAESYSQVQRENLNDALVRSAEALGKLSSPDEYESAYSALLLAMNELSISREEDTQKGQLNITAGKIIAAALVGALILAAQIFVYKMQKEKKR